MDKHPILAKELWAIELSLKMQLLVSLLLSSAGHTSRSMKAAHTVPDGLQIKTGHRIGWTQKQGRAGLVVLLLFPTR